VAHGEGHQRQYLDDKTQDSIKVHGADVRAAEVHYLKFCFYNNIEICWSYNAEILIVVSNVSFLEILCMKVEIIVKVIQKDILAFCYARLTATTLICNSLI